MSEQQRKRSRFSARRYLQHSRLAAGIAAALAAGAVAPAASAQTVDTQRYAIPAGPLEAALTSFAKTSGVLLVYQPELVRGRSSRGLNGDYETQAALRELLAGSGVEAVRDGDAWTLRALPAGAAQETQLPAVRVVDRLERSFSASGQESASKTGLSIREIPQTVSVVTQDQLLTRQVGSTKEALETIAGVNQYSGPGPFAGISGFGFFATQIRGVDIDHRYDMREDGFVSPPYYTRPDLAIYDRIEVVKGPSSVLNGRGSAGGFINQVRKKPQDQYRSEFEISAGSYDTYRIDADITGPLTDRVRGRVVAAFEDAGSFVDGVESERKLFAPSIEADITDSTRLLLQGLYQKDRFVGNPGFPLVRVGDDKYAAPDIPRSRYLGVPNEEKNEWEIFGITAQLDQQINDNWLATLRLNRTGSETPIDMDSYAYSYGGVADDGSVMLISSAFNKNDADVWSSEFRVQGSLDLFGRPATLGFGVDRSEVETHRIDDQYVTLGFIDVHATHFDDFPTVPTPGPGSDAKITQRATGAFAEFQVRPLDRLSVLAGLRYDRADTDSNFSGNKSDSEDSEATGRLGVVFDATRAISVYGLYAQSFLPVSETAAGGAVLKPQTGEIYEAGFKSAWLDGRLTANAAVFRIGREDVPISDPANGPGEFFSVSSGKQRSDGVELEINGEPLPGWKVSFGGSIVDSDFTERDDPNYGNQPKGTADWQLGAYTGYELQSGPLRGFGLGAGVFALGDRGLDDRTVDGYERFDVSAFYNGFKRVKVALKVRNVTNETYIEGFDRAGAYAQFGAPTTVMLSVRLLDGAGL